MNVALIGYGKAGQALFEELSINQYVESIHVYDPAFDSIITPATSRKENFVFHDKPINIDSSFDLVVVATPDHLHKEYILKSIGLGISCFVEKPLITSKTDLIEVINLINANPETKITTNLILRASPLFVEIRKLFINGAFGSNTFIEGKYLYGRWEKLVNGWRGAADYSVILGGLIHLVDLVCFISNEYNYECKINFQRLTSKFPSNVKDFGSIILTSPNTGIAHLTTSFSTPVDHRRDLAIYGDSGWIEVRGTEVRTGGNLAGLNLENLSAKSVSKGDLLSAFIKDINQEGVVEYLYPSRNEMIQVLKLCLGF
jgi:predicted dehydrogenase